MLVFALAFTDGLRARGIYSAEMGWTTSTTILNDMRGDERPSLFS